MFFEREIISTARMTSSAHVYRRFCKRRRDMDTLKPTPDPTMANLLPFSNLVEMEHGLRQREGDASSQLPAYVVNRRDELVFYTVATREMMFDWISYVHRGLRMSNLTLHRTMRYADMFLWRHGAESFLDHASDSVNALPLKHLPGHSILHLEQHDTLPRTLRRLMTTCLFVASKIEEVHPPRAAAFARASGVDSFSVEHLFESERRLIKELDHRLHYPTPLCFADLYLNDLIPETGERSALYEKLVALLLETVALAHESLDFLPSLLAASAITFVGARVFSIPRPALVAKFESAAHSSADLDKGCRLFEKLVYDLYRSERLARPLIATEKYSETLKLL